ncbi:sirohydrochlorin cobaltochelatase [Desulfobulbus alkaliphilus]|nr:sirohydrochlorin cobaltochelatase [Desulfobulbus alkaliphilus]
MTGYGHSHGHSHSHSHSHDHGPVAAGDKDPAILLVTFGTSIPRAQEAFVTIEQRVQAAFPDTEIRWAYTSSIVREKLAQNGTEIDSPEMAMARLMEDGYDRVLVQSLHMIPGAEFHEVFVNTKLFEQMIGWRHNFDKVEVGYPLLGSTAAMDAVIQVILTHVIPRERQADEAVVLMGHGTHHPSDAIYFAMMYKAQQADANMYVGSLSVSPSIEEIRDALVEKGIKKAYLIPLMTVAGDHAINDMAGDGKGSWKSVLTEVGIESVSVLKGLAEFDAIVDIWVENMKDIMEKLH